MHHACRRENKELDRRVRKESQSCRYPQKGCAIRGRPIIDHGSPPFPLATSVGRVTFCEPVTSHDWRKTAFRRTPDAFDLEFNHVSRQSRNRPVSRPQQFPTVPEPKEFSGMDGFVLSDTCGRNLFEREQHAHGRSFRLRAPLPLTRTATLRPCRGRRVRPGVTIQGPKGVGAVEDSCPWPARGGPPLSTHLPSRAPGLR